MDLFIMRHGIAEDRAATDAARNLTPEGRDETTQAGKALRKLKIQFSAVYSSPYNRTMQTAQLLLEGLQQEIKITPCDPLASGNDSNGLLQVISANSTIARVLLVGHDPDLTRLISTLLSGQPNTAVRMKKGCICKLSFLTKPAPAQAALEWLLTPKQLRFIAQS
jgi:phosphohistidine phosphatase